jgi:hypothetical protein
MSTDTPKESPNKIISKALSMLRRVTSPKYMAAITAIKIATKDKKASGGRVKPKKMMGGKVAKKRMYGGSVKKSK